MRAELDKLRLMDFSKTYKIDSSDKMFKNSGRERNEYKHLWKSTASSKF
jgi:hypothetical protein